MDGGVNMTDKEKRIRKALEECKEKHSDFYTLQQLDDIARRADVRRIDVMTYLRFSR